MRQGYAIEAQDKFVPGSYEGIVEPNYYCRAWNPKRLKYCINRAGKGTDHPGVGRCKVHGGSTPVKSGRYSKIKSPRLQALIAEYEADPDPLNILPELAAARGIFVDWVERYEEMTEALLAWHESWAYARPNAGLVESYRRVLEEHEILLNERGTDEGDFRWEDLKRGKKLIEALGSGAHDARPRQILDISHARQHVEAISKIVKRIEDVRSANAVSMPNLLRIMGEMGRVVDMNNSVADPEERLAAIKRDWLAIRL